MLWRRLILGPMLIFAITSARSGPTGAGEQSLQRVAYAVYFADDEQCGTDDGVRALGGEWNGRRWQLAGPNRIDTTTAWEKKYGTGLHVRPADVLEREARRLAHFTPNPTEPTGGERAPIDGDARVRIVLVDHNAVAQGFGGVDRYVRLAVRLCVRRAGAWESTRFDTVRGVEGKSEFWRARSDADRQKDFEEAFRLALAASLEWAGESAAKDWQSGSITVDSTFGVHGKH